MFRSIVAVTLSALVAFGVTVDASAQRSDGKLSVVPTARLQGKASLGADFLHRVNPGSVSALNPSPSGSPDVGQDIAVRIAIARATSEWGALAHVGTVIPLYDVAGAIIAYDVDFTIDGSPFGDYGHVAAEWQEFLSHRTMESVGVRRSPTDGQGALAMWSSKKYGSVTVSATLDAPPVRASRPGVSNFYAAGWIGVEIASQALGTERVQLVRAIPDGTWERLYEFTGGGRSVIVQGHEPYGWYDLDEYVRASLEGLNIRRQWNRERAASVGSTVEAIRDSMRTVNRARQQSWLEGSIPRDNPVYIPGLDYFTPYLWFGGCSPTSGSMVLNYWDEYGGYGRMTNFYGDADDPVSGRPECHVSDAQLVMIGYMHTDDQGNTGSCSDIDIGLEDYANQARGYCFSTWSYEGNWWDGWYCEEGRAEIDSGRPFVWSLSFYPGANGEGHSVAVVGYSGGGFICFNTWLDNGSVPEWADCSGSFWDFDYSCVTYAHPGCPNTTNTKLLSPDGFQTYGQCGTSGLVYAGETANIIWMSSLHPADHVELQYYILGDQLHTITASTPDDGSYTWDVPCTSSSTARVRIVQITGNGTVSSDGSYGDFAIEQPTVPAPVLQFPFDGQDCESRNAQLWWSDLPHAATYRVQVGTFCGSTLIDREVAGRSFDCPYLEYDTVYYWRVQAKTACGEDGPFSSCRWFRTVVAPPPAPTLLSPADGATSQPETGVLDWSDVSGAVGYHIYVSCESGVLVVSAVVAVSQYTYVLGDGTYRWRVVALSSCGQGGASSDDFAFTVGSGSDCGPGPELISPPDSATCRGYSGALAWAAIPGAAGYYVRIEDGGCGSGVEHHVTEPMYSYSALDPGRTYRWQVKEDCPCAVYSECFSFTTLDDVPHDVPHLDLPDDGAEDQPTAGRLEWRPPYGDGYRVQIGTACGEGEEHDVTTSWYDYTGLQEGTMYYWRVRLRDECNQLGPYSSCYSFRTEQTTGINRCYFQPGLSYYQGQQNAAIPVCGENIVDIQRYGLEVEFASDVFEYVGWTLEGTRGEGAWSATCEYVDHRIVICDVHYAEHNCPPQIPPGLGVMLKIIVNVRFDAPLGETTLEFSHKPWEGCPMHPFTPEIFPGTAEIGTNPSGVDDPGQDSGSMGGAPSVLTLVGAIPNPANGLTGLRFGIPRGGAVRLSVFDVVGREVIRLLDREFGPGWYATEWDTRDDRGMAVAAGVYVIRLSSLAQTTAKRLVVLR